MDFKLGQPVSFETLSSEGPYPQVKLLEVKQAQDTEKSNYYMHKNTSYDSYSYDYNSSNNRLKQKFDRLSEEKGNKFSAYDTGEDINLVEETKNYYQTSTDNFYTPLKALAQNSYDWKIKVRV